ncbi:MAG TPA: DUF1015 domain-containing protein [Thermoanaerobaculia bacterium]|nr:DUF1015 domain-containing protein [Thermoanaerobaculia bacterium]
MRLFAFEGLRYGASAGNPGPLAALPYDQINPALRDRYQAESPFQFVHLTCPVAPEGEDPYVRAAGLHATWMADGEVVRDEKPAIYPYVIELAGGGRRLGVVGLIEIADAATIRPHEQTLEKAIADRTALLEATRVDLEPALLLSDDGGKLDALVAEDIAGKEPLVDHLDPDGHHHLLFRVDDPARIQLYQQATEGPSAIADGHHRYKVAGHFARAHGAEPGTAASAKLAIVTSLSSPALTIDPIHRALGSAIDLDAIADASGADRRTVEAATGTALAEAVAAAGATAIGLKVKGRPPEIWVLDPERAPASLSPGARNVAVVLLHEIVYPALGLAPAAAVDGTTTYRSDPDVLFKMVENGEAGTGIWLPPMTPAAFALAIEHGEMLPPKSTRFLPKVMSGLVWADHESRVV